MDIFIRANSGGTPLTFSDLLMSISSANWKDIDARKEIKDLIDKVYEIGRPGFVISKDFVLKTCLVLFIDNIRFQLKNFTRENVKKFEDNWPKIRNSILSAFILFEKMGFNDKTFRAKNAAIPVIYYIYYNNLETTIIKPTYDATDKKSISQWLILSFLKSIFGGQPDSVLITMRKVLRENMGGKFPVDKLMEAFLADPAKNYSLDEDFIDGLLEAQKDSNEAFYVLHLLYPILDYSDPNIHQDHLHPATVFQSEEKLHSYIPEEDWDFAKDEKNWNSVSNLQLLNGILNSSKKDTPLKDWVEQFDISNVNLFLSESTSLDIKDFRDYIFDRRKNIKDFLKKIIS